jgi:hypothetical protein
LVAHDYGFRLEADEDVIGVIEYLSKARVPIFRLTHVTTEQPRHALHIVRLKTGAPAKAHMLNQTV